MFQAREEEEIFQTLNTSDENIVKAAQLAYDEYMSFLEMIKDDTRLVGVTAAESRLVDDKGTEFKIYFGIQYTPNESRIDCETLVHEDLEKQLDVLSVSCGCCLEWIRK